MNGAPPLEVSIVLVTKSLASTRKSLSYLRAQEGAARAELLLVVPEGEQVEPSAPELAGFGQVRILPVEEVYPPAFGRAEAIRAASTPLVLFAETHSYPQPGYLEALVAGSRAGPSAVVGPSMANANPRSLMSWANLFLDYGPWVETKRGGVMEDVPGHNALYERAALLELGDELAERLLADSLMHDELRARGAQLYLEPRARTEHLNVSSVRWSVGERFQSSRNFAGRRARQWTLWRRLLYVGGAPLIPAVRLKRIFGYIRRSDRPDLIPRVLPALLLALTISAVGELVGYAAGPGRASRLLSEIELYRLPYLRSSDRELELDESTWPA